MMAYRMLVVEDELLVRMDLTDRAQDAGFDTLEAGDASEALSILEGNGDIKVLFTDINMPGEMDGLALAHIARERWPTTEIIVSSGNVLPASAALPADARFLAKPCSDADLAKVFDTIKSRLKASA